jgi:hypothetical protein
MARKVEERRGGPIAPDCNEADLGSNLEFPQRKANSIRWFATWDGITVVNL